MHKALILLSLMVIVTSGTSVWELLGGRADRRVEEQAQRLFEEWSGLMFPSTFSELEQNIGKSWPKNGENYRQKQDKLFNETRKFLNNLESVPQEKDTGIEDQNNPESRSPQTVSYNDAHNFWDKFLLAQFSPIFSKNFPDRNFSKVKIRDSNSPPLTPSIETVDLTLQRPVDKLDIRLTGAEYLMPLSSMLKRIGAKECGLSAQVGLDMDRPTLESVSMSHDDSIVTPLPVPEFMDLEGIKAVESIEGAVPAEPGGPTPSVPSAPATPPKVFTKSPSSHDVPSSRPLVLSPRRLWSNFEAVKEEGRKNALGIVMPSDGIARLSQSKILHLSEIIRRLVGFGDGKDLDIAEGRKRQLLLNRNYKRYPAMRHPKGCACSKHFAIPKVEKVGIISINQTSFGKENVNDVNELAVDIAMKNDPVVIASAKDEPAQNVERPDPPVELSFAPVQEYRLDEPVVIAPSGPLPHYNGNKPNANYKPVYEHFGTFVGYCVFGFTIATLVGMAGIMMNIRLKDVVGQDGLAVTIKVSGRRESIQALPI